MKDKKSNDNKDTEQSLRDVKLYKNIQSYHQHKNIHHPKYDYISDKLFIFITDPEVSTAIHFTHFTNVPLFFVRPFFECPICQTI